jgi:hypothetical protein
MKKTLLSLILAFGLSSALSLQAETDVETSNGVSPAAVSMNSGLSALISHMDVQDMDIYENQKDTLDLDPQIIEKNQAVAKFFSKSAKSKPNYNIIGTNVVTYEITYLGVLCHIGWYLDGSIVTAIDGTEAAKQVVFLNGCVVGISYDMEMKDDYFIHRYKWGKVYSYIDHQIIKFN